MNPYVTREEFLELKSWMASHFVTKPEFYALSYKVDLVTQEVTQFRYEFAEFKQQTLQRFDAIFDMLERLDQERIFLHEAVLRIEEKISS